MRSPLARAIGLGSAKEGVGAWWAERVSAVALIPLTLWFAASLIAHIGSDYTAFVAWLRIPLVTTLMILLLITLFYHAALGLQVVIEDYIHSSIKVRGGDRGACWLLCARARGFRGNISYCIRRLSGSGSILTAETRCESRGPES
jgi:succinate dehydrogenase membrane anchor subunit